MDKRTPTVSVIVPIYNVEDYLAECLDSILSQTLKNIEVICINDGSTDSSPSIIRSYEKRDSRIVVIDKPNGGYGHSVNRGLEIARGEWISIVEPDDKIDPRMYADLTALGNLAGDKPVDIVKGSYWHYFHFEDRNPYVERPNLMNCMPQGICELDLWEDPEMLRHHPSIWSAIYRRSFVEKYGIRMIEPKGAGWADNPWLFRTTLQAERIVWTPAPYYYYRQTNPDASSNLKDFHLPFDRLRDIRAIYDEFNITNKGLLEVLYHRSFNYICTSLLEEFHFPENDPEMQDLIREVFETFDEDILMDKKNAIPNGRKNYWRDFMGKRLAEVKPHKRPNKPLVSFVLPMHDDRRGLWETLNGLLKQSYDNFEVICVDCTSPDRSLQIVTDLSAIDERFVALSGAATVAEGFNLGMKEATGDYVMLLRPGVAFEHWSALRTMADRLESLQSTCDMVLFKSWFPASRLIPHGFKVSAVEMQVDGIETDVVLAVFPDAYGRLFSRAFLLSENIEARHAQDGDGYGLCVESAAKAQSAAFIAAPEVRVDTRRTIVRSTWSTEDDLIAFALGKYEAMFHAAEHTNSDLARRIARNCIVCHLAIDVARIGLARSGRKYFETLRDVFFNEYGIYTANLGDCANYLDFAVLEEAFSLDYDDYAKNLLKRQQKSLIDLTWQRDRKHVRIEKIMKSGSYITGKKIARIAKMAIPKKARQEYLFKAAKDADE